MYRREVLGLGAMLPFLSFRSTPAQADDTPFSTDGRVTLKAYKGLVEEHLIGTKNALKALATTSDARSEDWARIKPALKVLGGTLASAAAVWYAKTDGSYYTADGDLNEQSLSDREYFPQLMSGQDVGGALVVSKSTGHRSVIIATPIRTAEAVIGALGISIRARLLSELVELRTDVPKDLVFYAIDGKGQTVIHKDPEKMFAFPSDLGDASLKAAVKTMLSSDHGSVAYQFQGTSRRALFQASELTGWRFVLAKIMN
jgi:methyl-accepting chemotaxis protein